MKQSKWFISLMSALLAFCFIVSGIGAPIPMVDAHDRPDYSTLTPDEIEQKLKEVNAQIDELKNKKDSEQEYINALNEKISILQADLEVAEKTIANSKNRIKSLEDEYSANEREIELLQTEIADLTVKEDELQREYNICYNKYAKRARALYISGDMNVLTTLITSDDISTLFTRLEMLRRVSELDKELLEGLQNEGEQLLATKASLVDKRETLTTTQANLTSTKENLEQTINTLETQQKNYNEKQAEYETQREQANAEMLSLNLDGKINELIEDREDLMEINRQIEQAAKEWEERQEAATTTTTTTQKPTTTKKVTTTKQSGSTTKQTTTAKKTTTTTKKPPTTASKRLSLTYPVPAQKRITCGWMSYPNHTGVDFACPSGSRVVAAEDGEVIVSTDLKNSKGAYRSYGRYIVIAHTKKNSSGNYVFTLYAHNSSRLVEVGETVTKGQTIAYSGSTGNSTGPHCHFEVRTPSAAYADCVNPTPYLP